MPPGAVTELVRLALTAPPVPAEMSGKGITTLPWLAQLPWWMWTAWLVPGVNPCMLKLAVIVFVVALHDSDTVPTGAWSRTTPTLVGTDEDEGDEEELHAATVAMAASARALVRTRGSFTAKHCLLGRTHAEGHDGHRPGRGPAEQYRLACPGPSANGETQPPVGGRPRLCQVWATARTS